MKEFFEGGGDRTFQYLDGSGGYTTVCICQNSQDCPLKRVNFPVCKLCLSRPFFFFYFYLFTFGCVGSSLLHEDFAASGGYSSLQCVRGRLMAAAALVAEHGLCVKTKEKGLAQCPQEENCYSLLFTKVLVTVCSSLQHFYFCKKSLQLS